MGTFDIPEKVQWSNWVVATSQYFGGIFIPKIGEDEFSPILRVAYFSNGLVKNHQAVITPFGGVKTSRSDKKVCNKKT